MWLYFQLTVLFIFKKHIQEAYYIKICGFIRVVAPYLTTDDLIFNAIINIKIQIDSKDEDFFSMYV